MNEVSHSQRGEYWLGVHLERAGKTKEGLARVLWEGGWTAVAEVGSLLLSIFLYPFIH